MRFYWVIVFFSVVPFVRSQHTQSSFDEVAGHIINNQFDSAYANFIRLEKPSEIKILAPVLFRFAGYRDYQNFLMACNFPSRQLNNNLVQFIDRHSSKPQSYDAVELGYVKLQAHLIDFIANELTLDECIDFVNQLDSYLSKIKKKDRNWEHAKLYADWFKLLTGVIEQDTNLLKLGFKKSDQALEFKDTLLHLRFALLSSDYFVHTNQLKSYNEFMFEKYELSKKWSEPSTLKYAIADRLINGLSFAQYEDTEFIESIIKKLFFSKIYKDNSYPVILHYILFHSDQKDLANNSLLKDLGFNSLEAFVKDGLENVLPKLNNDDACNFLLQASRLMILTGNTEFASRLMIDLYNTTRSVYSNDLVEALADFKTTTISKEKEFILAQQKERNTLYLLFGGVLLVGIALLTYTTYQLNRRRLTLLLKDKENKLLLAEKDLLMREIHHRVKNNFELVGALLDMQNSEIDHVEAKEKLMEGQARISSLSLIHHKLYEGENQTVVEADAYIRELVDLVLGAAKVRDRVQVKIQTNNISLDVDTMIPLGLILNELLTNSYKYDFKKPLDWTLEIELSRDQPKYYTFVYQTKNNVDLHVEIPNRIGNLGTLLINSLVKQLRGTIESEFKNGVYYRILFMDKISRKVFD